MSEIKDVEIDKSFCKHPFLKELGKYELQSDYIELSQ